MIQRMTVLVATLALGLFLVPGLATAAHHEKDEGHDKSNPCMEKEEGKKKDSAEHGEHNPCMAKEKKEKKDEKGSGGYDYD